MTDRIVFRSLRARMIAMVVAAFVAAALVFFGVNELSQWCVNHWYLSESAVRARNDTLSEQLRAELRNHPFPASDSSSIEHWVEKHRATQVVVFLPGHPYEVSWWGTQEAESSAKYAWDLSQMGYDFYSIPFSDGECSVAISEDSEYRLYDLGVYTAAGLSIAVLVSFLLAHSRWVTGRISLLSREVNEVSKGNLNYEIIPRYRDEISSLARDVETMRTTIIQRGLSEQSALQANHDLITALSHDIRNPLTALIGYLELLEMDAVSLPEADREYVRACLDKSYRIRDLTGEMFRYFLVFGEASQTVEMEEYDAEVFLWQLLGECAEDLISRGFMIETEALEMPCTLRTDVSLIKRVVDNLVSNIVKYADHAAAVTIRAEIEDDFVRVHFANRIAALGPDAVESNHIGLRTCEAILRLLEGSFTSRAEDDRFIAEFTLPLVK